MLHLLNQHRPLLCCALFISLHILYLRNILFFTNTCKTEAEKKPYRQTEADKKPHRQKQTSRGRRRRCNVERTVRKQTCQSSIPSSSKGFLLKVNSFPTWTIKHGLNNQSIWGWWGGVGWGGMGWCCDKIFFWGLGSVQGKIFFWDLGSVQGKIFFMNGI